VPGHPPDIGGAPENVIVVQIENPFTSDVGAYCVATGSVQDALGLSCGAGRIKKIERMFGIDWLGRTIRRCGGHQFMPPVIATRLHPHGG